MGNEFKGRPEHSAEYFGDARDHWWNEDFVAMVAKRWRLEGTRSVLDVGCGVGHWGRVLARVLPRDARLVGVDREPRWVEEAATRAAAAGLAERFTYQVGAAESLPFEDGAFDVVTCQTLLIHVRDPDRVLAEMVRVTRPGGLVAVAEPTNVAEPLLESIALGAAPETTASLMYFQLACQLGKQLLGEGNNLIGESLPLLFRRAGLTQVEIRLNDRCAPMLPPYETPPERAQAEEARDAAEREMGLWDETTTKRYFLAGGGTESQFGGHWATALDHRGRAAESVSARTYSCAGGGVFYLAWGSVGL